MQGTKWKRNQYSRFCKEFIKVSITLGNSAPTILMQEFRDLYTIFSVDLSSQATVSITNQLTINIERRDILSQNAETLHYPLEIDAVFVIISEA